MLGDDLTAAQVYALGLLVEESGEIGHMAGKAIRFGIDSPGKTEAPYWGRSARKLLTGECGDILAAIEYSCHAGLLSIHEIDEFRKMKIAKLLDPVAVDNLGRRLAPYPWSDVRGS